MHAHKADDTTYFSQPIRQIVTMLVAVALVAAGAWLISDTVMDIIETNPLLNGFIAFIFFLGVITCFWQVFILVQSVSWIEGFARHDPGAETANPPRLLAPLASLLRSRGARMQISSSASRSIQDSVATRIDEARDITRYLVNLLVFLGLLGTFYGLATTVPAVVETIQSLTPKDGETGMQVFGKLMTGLESQLGGMGTAFSSSLLGLAGSLVVGLLELFAGHGQNRFYRELEEWLSSITRVGFSSGDGDGGDMGPVSAILDHLTGQIEVLQTLFAQAEANKAGLEEGLGALTAAVDRLAARPEVETGQVAALTKMIAGQSRFVEGQERMAKGQDNLIAAMTLIGAGQSRLAEGQERMAEGQDRLIRALTQMAAGQSRLAEGQDRMAEGQERLILALTGPESRPQADAENRMRLRSIDVQLLRILEEMSAGRLETLADLRGDISALTASVRALSRSTTGRG